MSIIFHTNCPHLAIILGICIYARRFEKAMFLHSIQAITVAIINLVIYMGEPKYSLENIKISSVNIKQNFQHLNSH